MCKITQKLKFNFIEGIKVSGNQEVRNILLSNSRSQPRVWKGLFLFSFVIYKGSSISDISGGVAKSTSMTEIYDNGVVNKP